jgi:hypothetical protein
MRKIVLAVVAASMLFAATPLLAQPSGTWAGTGEGWCPYPVPYPAEYMKPWQNWKGFVENDDVFYGKWWDAGNNSGTFNGTVTIISGTEAYSEGEWYWIDYRFDPPLSHYMGTFSMKFKYPLAGMPYCYGEWQGYVPSGIHTGTMKGKPVY